MAFYLVELPEGAGTTRFADAMVVSAADATDAKAIAKNEHGGGKADWTNATATLLADVASNTDDALVGWIFTVSVDTPAGVPLFEVSVTGTTALDTIDTIAAQLVTLITAQAEITLADYTGQLLTVAEIGDDIGDHILRVTVKPPVVNDDGGERKSGNEVIVGYIDTIVDQGIAGAVLTVEFPVDAYVRPTVLKAFFTGDSV